MKPEIIEMIKFNYKTFKIYLIKITRVWFPSRKTFALVSPAPDSMGDAENPSKTMKSPWARSPSLVC